MASARSFSYSCSPNALSVALKTTRNTLLLLERSSTYDLPQAHERSDAPDRATTRFRSTLDLVELYFDDAIRTGKSSLLSHQQEIELAQAIEMGELATAELSAQKASTSRAHSLKQLIKRGNQAREQLITANLRLVVSVATRYRNSAIPFADLIQEGNIGLTQAVDKFDWRRGTRFSTYAVWWIRQSISRSLANDSRLIRIPVHAHQKLATIARSKRDLYQVLGRDPTPTDIARDTALSEDLIRDLMIHLNPPASLEAPIEMENGSATSLAAIAHEPETPSIEDQVVCRISQKALQQALQSLTPREQHFLTRRYGLNGRERLSLRAAGEALGLTKGQAQGIETNALAKLRSRPEVSGLRAHP